MPEPFLAEIRVFSFGFAPRGWALCNGQLLPINQNQALFSLLGTIYGGDGRTSFGLPNLQGRTPIHFNQAFNLGTQTGQPTVALSAVNLPVHSHEMRVSSAGADRKIPNDGILAVPENHQIYGNPDQALGLNTVVQPAGQGVPYNNYQPYLVINYCIALQGYYPSRN